MGKLKTAVCAAPACKKKIGRHDAARVEATLEGTNRRITFHLECAQRLEVK